MSNRAALARTATLTAHTDQRNNQLRIVNNHCSFGDEPRGRDAVDHPPVAAEIAQVVAALVSLEGRSLPTSSRRRPLAQVEIPPWVHRS